MVRARILLAALATVLVSACATSNTTPYQPLTGQGGYSETRIEQDRFRINFKGNSVTSRETVENLMLYRAAELTLQQGFDTFTVVDRDTDRNSRFQSIGRDPWRYSGRFFHPYYGWYPAFDPFWDDQTIREITRYEASAEIRLGKGPKGDDPNAFDARQVSQNLASVAIRPAP
jgi:hypothetical protein